MKPYIALFGNGVDPKWTKKIQILMDALCCRGVRLCYYAPLLESLRQLQGFDNEWDGIPTSSCDSPQSLATPPLPFEGDTFTSYSDLPSDVSLLLSLGGDGTFLNSLTIVRDRAIPVAGINFGRLGFLTSARVMEEGNNDWMDIFSGNLPKLEERPLLTLFSERLPEDFYPYALNEISIQRGDPQMMSIELAIDGQRIPTYWADGLMVATDTGSTAYSLSVGGPIVTPGSNVFIIAPIAPHNLNVRPLIVPDTSVLELTVHSQSGSSVVTVDNRSFIMEESDHVRISRATFGMKYLPSTESGFFKALQEKLLWGEDKRNNSL